MRTSRGVSALVGTALAVGALAGCGDATDSSDGDNNSDAQVNSKNCVDDEGRNVCDAMGNKQVLVAATANGKRVELYNKEGGDPVNVLRGEGRPVAAGDQLMVVCRKGSSGFGDGYFGVLLHKEFSQYHVQPAYYATGKVDDTNWGEVAFIDFAGIDNADDIEKQLEDKLSQQFDDVSGYTSCNDNRVVTTTLGKQLVTGS